MEPVADAVAVIGLGTMGAPMARNLRRAGVRCAVHDLQPSAAAALEAEGAVAAPSPGAAARGASVVLLSLPDADVVDVVLFGPDGVAGAAAPGTVVVDTTTGYPPSSAAAAERLAAAGIGFLDAPVSGGRAGAEAGTLSIMVGGPADVLARCRPVLDIIGARVTHLGEQVGAGGYGKLANQIFVSVHFAAIAEGLTFAAKAGLDVEQLVGALEAGWANSTVLGIKAPQILDRAFDQPIGTVAIQHKDLRTIVASMADLGIDLPLSPMLAGMYEELLAEGKAGLDQIALVELFERRAGVTIRRRGVSPPGTSG